MNYLLLYLKQTFTLDLRALALLRIGLGALLLIDLYTRASDLEAHYANSGVLPITALLEFNWNQFFISFHTSSGLWQVQAVLFLIAAFFAVCLLLGYKTRFATIISWVLLLSLQNRNSVISQGGDDLLRMMLFWGMFLPLNKYYAFDQKRAGQIQRNITCFSAATVAFVVQIFLLYFCTAVLKHAPEWHTEGTAIYYALSLDQILLPVGKLLYPYYDFLKGLTFAVYYTELLLPFLLFIPFYNSFFRLFVVVVLAGLHLGISVTLFVGLFFLINLVSILALIPENAMNWLERKVLMPIKRFLSNLIPKSFSLSKAFAFSWNLNFSATPALKNGLTYFREVFVALTLVYVIWWNLDNTPGKMLTFPESFRWPGYVMRLDQNWGMFSPAVFKDDGWYILEGKTENGNLIDLNQNGKKVTYKKPEAVVKLFKNDRWRKYGENYLFVSNSWMRGYYCNYMMRIWNEEADKKEQITSLEVVYMKEVSLENYKTEPVKREVLCNCGHL